MEADEVAGSIVHSYIAKLQSIRSYDVIVETVDLATESDLGGKNTKLTTRYDRTRVLIDPDQEFSLVAKLSTQVPEHRTDWEKKPRDYLTEEIVRMHFFHSKTALQMIVGSNNELTLKMDFEEFRRLYVPLVELHYSLPAPLHHPRVTRDAIYETMMTKWDNRRISRRVGDDVYLTIESKPGAAFKSTLVMDERRLVAKSFVLETDTPKDNLPITKNVTIYESIKRGEFDLPVHRQITDELAFPTTKKKSVITSKLEWRSVNEPIVVPDANQISETLSGFSDFLFPKSMPE
jgi:hypothetical protein